MSQFDQRKKGSLVRAKRAKGHQKTDVQGRLSIPSMVECDSKRAVLLGEATFKLPKTLLHLGLTTS